MAQTNNFDNVLPLMEGMVKARSPLLKGELQELARKLNEAGKLDTILTIVGTVDRTAASLQYRSFTREIFFGLHMAGQRSNWAGEGLAQALKQAENMAHKMEHEPKHREERPRRKKIVPLRMSPEIAGVGLELATAQAVNDYQGEDRDGKVTSYARRVLALWDNGTWAPVRDATKERTSTEPGTEAKESGTEPAEVQRSYVRASALLYWLPLYNGLRLVKQVDKGLKAELKTKLAELLAELDPIVRNELAKSRALANGRERRELVSYKEVGVE